MIDWCLSGGCAAAAQVAWLDHNSIPLTYEDRRVVDDTRFSIIRPYIREWNLQIRDIRWDDEGQYRCTINTNPVKSKLVMLHVKGTKLFYYCASHSMKPFQSKWFLENRQVLRTARAVDKLEERMVL